MEIFYWFENCNVYQYLSDFVTRFIPFQLHSYVYAHTQMWLLTVPFYNG